MRALPACQPCGQLGVHLEQEEGASVVALEQLGLPDAEQPWPSPSPWQQRPSDGGDLLLEQGQSQVQSQVKVELNLEKQKEMDQAQPRALLSACHPLW